MPKRQPCADCGGRHNVKSRGARRCALRALKDAEDKRRAELRVYGAGLRPPGER